MTKPPATLADACEFIVDCLHATAPIQDSGFPLIRTPNIGKGRLDLSGVQRVSEDTYTKWTRRAVPIAGDLILAREAPAGNVAVVGDDETVCLGQRTVHLRPDKTQVDPQFLCYFLLAPHQQSILLAGETGATSKHVNMKDIRKLPLSGFPKLDSQQKIGRTIAAYDDLIENNRRRIGLLEEAARLLYREWFVYRRFPGHEHVTVIDGLPEGWERRKLGSVLTLQRGFDLPVDSRIAGDVPVYGSTGVVGQHDTPKVTSHTLITGRSGSLGEVCFVDEPCWPLNTSLWVKEFKGISPCFAYFLLQHMNLAQFNGGASVPTLDRKVVHAKDVVIPTMLLISLFEDQAGVVFAHQKVLRQQNKKLAQARDLLLTRMMSGEITI